MRIPGSKAARRFSRWLKARILGGAIILGYHRLAETAQDGYEVSVSPGHFEEQMDILSQSARVMSLSRLVRHLREGSLPPRSVAVTFDDGYADNLYLAKPILEKIQVPATIFMCTGYWGRQFWWDELEFLIMTTTSDPGKLSLRDGKNQIVWKPTVELSEVKDDCNVAIRRKLRHELYQVLLPMDLEEQNHAMDEIRSWPGLTTSTTSAARSMDQTELLQLAASDLIEIGSHTRTHPMLPLLSETRQRAEILSSREELEDLLGKPISGFAYPNGKSTERTKSFLQKAGFDYACVSLEDVVRPGCDLFALPRFWQKDVDGDKFLQGVNTWLS